MEGGSSLEGSSVNDIAPDTLETGMAVSPISPSSLHRVDEEDSEYEEEHFEEDIVDYSISEDVLQGTYIVPQNPTRRRASRRRNRLLFRGIPPLQCTPWVQLIARKGIINPTTTWLLSSLNNRGANGRIYFPPICVLKIVLN
ncbi:hypothetical protein OIU84_026079 [Salix udensis]|uniref:Uncharacterized protein n=1 Tax=Salix udensis TaxID=889485 RepID=A0AAD6KLI2_9ROSI|nr:hypothetical protein OIU84_026079 [Salix udensis]